MIFLLKTKQARTANKGDSRRITEVTGEFSARSCDPPHPYMKNAPMAQKFCDQGRKTTFATLSALNRLRWDAYFVRSKRHPCLCARRWLLPFLAQSRETLHLRGQNVSRSVRSLELNFEL